MFAINNRKKRLLYSLVLNILVLLVALLVFKPFFEEIDDTHIAMISEGAYGYREWHLIYTNVILGKIYVYLNGVLPMIRWHILFQLFFIFIAYVLLTYLFSENIKGTLISVIGVLATFYELYVSIQYTKTASFVCIIGFLVILYLVRNNSKYIGAKLEFRIILLMADVLILYGALLRKESLFIAGVPALFLGVYELIVTKKWSKYLCFFVPVFVISFVCILVDNYIYASDTEWKAFKEYNQARMHLIDYRYDVLDYSTYGEELKELDISENDSFVFLTYQYADDKFFSTDKLSEIGNHFGKKPINDYVFRTWYGRVIEEFSRQDVSLFMLCILAILLVACEITQAKAGNMLLLFLTVLIGALCSTALFYFHYSGRWSHRLVTALSIPAIYVILYIFMNENWIVNPYKVYHKKAPAVAVILCLIALFMNVSKGIHNRLEYTEWMRSQSEVRDIIAEVTNDALYNPNTPLYVYDTFMFNDIWKFDVFSPATLGELKNFISCGSWFGNSPITNRITDAYGYDNPYDALMSEKDDVILLDRNNREYKSAFIKEHYGVELNK